MLGKRLFAFSILVAAGCGSSSADALYGLFDYDRAEPPIGEDCGAVASAIGPDSTWHGEFSGKRYDDFADRYYPFAARGCFDSEIACRIWQNQAVTYIGQGPIYYTTCRRGG
jgi:hypothetical protein